MGSTLLLIFLLTISVVNGDYYSDVAKFCSMNGLNYITISSLPYLRTEIQQLSSEFQKQNLRKIGKNGGLENTIAIV